MLRDAFEREHSHGFLSVQIDTGRVVNVKFGSTAPADGELVAAFTAAANVAATLGMTLIDDLPKAPCGSEQNTPESRDTSLSMDAIRAQEYQVKAELLRLEAAAIDDPLLKERLLAQSSVASLGAKQIANLCNSSKRCDV
ncbi:hypothetical protein [Xylella fastidiosa]|uniref:hypothetical protein n=1 Tax=Xylella fastidiosa TaxID=2371 RepID=UPI000AD37AB7|nr:hypothetical protein [Xylella fastidiosa]WNY18566.1 hypothetical protein RO839_08770 [Xylella fastidiosa]WNY20853.1 hypothetical protein RO838_08785 [Xylella fastidiosa]